MSQLEQTSQDNQSHVIDMVTRKRIVPVHPSKQRPIDVGVQEALRQEYILKYVEEVKSLQEQIRARNMQEIVYGVIDSIKNLLGAFVDLQSLEESYAKGPLKRTEFLPDFNVFVENLVAGDGRGREEEELNSADYQEGMKLLSNYLKDLCLDIQQNPEIGINMAKVILEIRFKLEFALKNLQLSLPEWGHIKRSKVMPEFSGIAKTLERDLLALTHKEASVLQS